MQRNIHPAYEAPVEEATHLEPGQTTNHAMHKIIEPGDVVTAVYEPGSMLDKYVYDPEMKVKGTHWVRRAPGGWTELPQLNLGASIGKAL